MPNVFSDNLFLETFARSYHPESGWEILDVRCESLDFRLLSVNGVVMVENQLVDFFEPSDKPAAAPRAVPYIPRASVSSVPASDVLDRRIEHEGLISPYLLWKGFSDWNACELRFKERSREVAKRFNLQVNVARKRKAIEKQLGPLVFEYDDGAEHLAEFYQWKSARYHEIGAKDLWQSAANRRFIENLHAVGLLRISTLKAGDRLIALHLGFDAGGRFYWWLPTFDRDLGKYSVGRVLLSEILKYSFDHGHREFDFLNGGEAYKWCYATDVRLVRSLGRPSFVQRTKQAVKQAMHTITDRSESVRSMARATQNLLQRVGVLK